MSAPKRFPASLKSAAAPQRELLMPQRHLHQATRDAARLARPSGTGLDSGAVRERMVSVLRNVDEGLARRVADGLGMALPAAQPRAL